MDALSFLAPEPETAKPECRALVPVKKRVGRPEIKITPELADKICDLLAEGKSVREIGKMEGMPSVATIRRWVRTDKGFREQYLAAKQDHADDLFEQILEIADNGQEDFKLDTSGDIPVVKVNKEHLARSALRIETRFRFIAKLAPRKYADTQALPAPVEPIEAPRNGDDAKVIDGTAVEVQHPLYESCQAWGRAARGENP